MHIFYRRPSRVYWRWRVSENGWKEESVSFAARSSLYSFRVLTLTNALWQHATKMHTWAKNYARERTAVNKKNKALYAWLCIPFFCLWTLPSLKGVMQSAHLKYNVALATPTMRRTLQVFNLRLTCLTATGTFLPCTPIFLNHSPSLVVWHDIRSQVGQEYEQFRYTNKMGGKNWQMHVSDGFLSFHERQGSPQMSIQVPRLRMVVHILNP